MSTEIDTLLDGVLRGDLPSWRSFLAELRPHCIQKLYDRFGYLADAQGEILDDAESLLFDWSIDEQARRRLPRGEALGTLAFRLVSEVVRQRSRREKRHAWLVRALSSTAEVSHEPSSRFETDAIVAEIAALPAMHREVLEAEVAFQCEGGQRPAQVLGLREGAARMRLNRARAALLLARRNEVKKSEVVDG
jgi:DNA-directed RNA polymerase specialized sigma24 family protein